MHKRENTRDSGSIDEKTNLILPYIRGYSEKIEPFYRKLNVRVIFKYQYNKKISSDNKKEVEERR